MKLSHVWFAAPVLALFAMLAVTTTVRAQSAEVSPNRAHRPLVTDWSHRHLVFTHIDALAKSNPTKSMRLLADHRFRQQLARRGAAAYSPAPLAATLRRERRPIPTDPMAPASEGSLERDWTAVLAPAGGFGTVGNNQYPAKFEFDVNAVVTAANCASDFVVYNNNNVSGSTAGFVQNATNFGLFFSAPTVGSQITITPPVGGAVVFTAIANGGTLVSKSFKVGTSAATAAANFAAAVNALEVLDGGAAGTFPYTATTAFGSAVIITDVAQTGLDSGAGGNNTTTNPFDCFNFFGFGCTNPQDFTFFSKNFFGGRGGGGAASAPNLIGLMNLYSGSPAGICLGTAPTVKFAYAVSTIKGATTVSPALSEDGTKIAIIESTKTCPVPANGCVVGSMLHLVKWANNSGTIAAPVTPANSTAANFNTCTAPCMVSLTVSTSPDSNSAPFIDYTNDRLFVGDDAGNLREVNNVFLGTPAVAWQATVDNGFALTGPVYDPVSDSVFVADANGFLTALTAATGAISHQQSTNAAGTGNGFPIPDPPIVDSGAQTVTVFVSNDADVNGAHASVDQFTTDFSTGAALPVANSGVQMHDGDFDNTYYSGIDYQDSYLYFCGKNPGNANDDPAIQRVSFDSTGIILALDPNFVGVGQADQSECSPLTEVYSGGVDYMFFSVQSGGSGSNCTVLGGTGVAASNAGSGCVMSIVVTDGVGSTMPTTITASLGEPGGTSGIIIDNVSSAAQASSIYFTPLAFTSTGSTANGNCPANTGCAVKATQSALK